MGRFLLMGGGEDVYQDNPLSTIYLQNSRYTEKGVIHTKLHS